MKLHTFQESPVTYIETMQVKDGVECDTYSFDGDGTKDLAIVRVAKGSKTPLQKVLLGNKTIEGFVGGKGTLIIRQEDGTAQSYHFDEADASQVKSVEVKVGQIMQWSADTNLTFYEICNPPYQDGRFENLPEELKND